MSLDLKHRTPGVAKIAAGGSVTAMRRNSNRLGKHHVAAHVFFSLVQGLLSAKASLVTQVVCTTTSHRVRSVLGLCESSKAACIHGDIARDQDPSRGRCWCRKDKRHPEVGEVYRTPRLNCCMFSAAKGRL